MSRPTKPRAEFFLKRGIWRIRGGVAALGYRPWGAGLERFCRGWTPGGRRRRLGEERPLVQVDQLRAGEHADEAAEREEGAERDPPPAVARRAARQQRDADD